MISLTTGSGQNLLNISVSSFAWNFQKKMYELRQGESEKTGGNDFEEAGEIESFE